jgi:hypothetical protein
MVESKSGYFGNTPELDRAPVTTNAVNHLPARGVLASTPVRFLVFSVALIAAYIGVQLAVAWARGLLPSIDRGLVTAAGCGLASVLLLLLYAALVRLFERRRPSELALSPGAGLAVTGTAGGFLLFALVLAVLFGLGLAHWGGGGGTAQVAPMAVAAVFAAVGEELAIRGGVFRVLEEGLGSLVALILSASLFGLLHAANAGATLVSTVAIAVEAGLLLGAAYMATRNLWLPIGLHLGWNFTEGGIFGATVSGGRSHGVWPVSIRGPELLSGGGFGPEASVVAMAVGLLATFALLAVAVRRGEWRSLRLRLWTA